MNTPYHPFLSDDARTTYLAYYDEAATQWPIPSETKMVETAYGQTFVRISGPVEAPPLVLLPGAGSTSLMWTLSIEALSTDYRTYAIDSLINTGCVGRSVYTRTISNAEQATDWLDDLFDGLGLADEVNLIGPSYGGWVASQYALRYPNRLRKMVWIAPAGTILPFSDAYLQHSMALYIAPGPDTFSNYFKWCFSDLAEKHPDMLNVMVEEFALTMQSFVPPNPQEVPVLTAMSDEELQHITTPTLCLIGENDVLYAAKDAMQRLHTVAPQIETTLIPDAGHDLLLVQRDMVNQEIVAFLQT